MNEMEAKAYKISLIYLEKAPKLFPKEVHFKVPKGDPRKSYVFKCCHKLLRTSGNDLKDEDIKLYVQAQLDILKHITQGQEHPRITPDILAGPNAWNRWLVWKSKYDKVKKFAATSTSAEINTTNREKEALEKLKKTKLFFSTAVDTLTPENIQTSLENGDLWLWVRWGKVCYYYLMISPIVKKWLEKSNLSLADKVSFDELLYKNGITNAVIEFFKTEFSYEFKQ
jgi:hypothetical protein